MRWVVCAKCGGVMKANSPGAVQVGLLESADRGCWWCRRCWEGVLRELIPDERLTEVILDATGGQDPEPEGGPQGRS